MQIQSLEELAPIIFMQEIQESIHTEAFQLLVTNTFVVSIFNLIFCSLVGLAFQLLVNNTLVVSIFNFNFLFSCWFHESLFG